MIRNTSCLIQAAKNLNIEFETFEGIENLLKISKNKKYYFPNCTTPLNSQDISFIALDKEFTYRTLEKVINMPETISFFDPNVQPEYQHYVREKNVDEMVEKVISKFGEKVIVKMNSGKRKTNVYKCCSHLEIKSAFEKIFDHKSKNYDFVALAQKKVDIMREFRVIVYKKKIELIYTKWTFDKVEDLELQNRLRGFLNPMFEVFDLQYGGLDIALDKENKLWLIEINTAPRFEPFAKKNGEEDIIKLYEKILSNLD